jgi:hypothetical protein
VPLAETEVPDACVGFAELLFAKTSLLLTVNANKIAPTVADFNSACIAIPLVRGYSHSD